VAQLSTLGVLDFMTKYMRYIQSLTLALASGLFLVGCAGISHHDDSLRTQKGAVVITESSFVGAITNRYSISLRVEVVRYSSPDIHRIETGAMVYTVGAFHFVPTKDIPSLIGAIDRVLVVQAAEAPFGSFHVDCTASGISLHRSDAKGDAACWIDAGGGRFFTADDDAFRQFRAILIEVEKRFR
jgi:hypothetical protein